MLGGNGRQHHQQGNLSLKRKVSSVHVLLFALEEPSDAFDRHVVGFGSARCEHDIFLIRSDQIGHVLKSDSFTKSATVLYSDPSSTASMVPTPH